MLSLQRNSGRTVSEGGAQTVSAAFNAPLTAGNGLIVAGYFLGNVNHQPRMSLNLSIRDSMGHAYISLGACGAQDDIEWVSGLRLWYVPASKGGADTVTLTQVAPSSALFFCMTLSIFEYPGALSKIDNAAFSTGVGRSSLTLTVSLAAGDLLFGFAAAGGLGPGINLDPGSDYILEQGIGVMWPDPPYVMAGSMAVDKLVAGPGLQSVVFDFTQGTSAPLETAALVALVSPNAPAPGTGSSSPSGQSGGSFTTMSLSAIPGFFDLSDGEMAGGQACADDLLLKLNHNAKFSAVRSKLIFMGFYADGDTVPTPVDPDDAYAYSRAECQFVWMIYSSRAPAPGFVPGQAAPPAQANSQPGTLYNFPGQYDVNDATGLVTCRGTYWQNGQETPSSGGILKVYAVCLRLSVNTSN
jgi:hypothetical protein